MFSYNWEDTSIVEVLKSPIVDLGRDRGCQHISKGHPSLLLAAEATGNLLCESNEMNYMASGSLKQSSCPSQSKWM